MASKKRAPRETPKALHKQPGSLKQQAEAAGLDVNAYAQQVLRLPKGAV